MFKIEESAAQEEKLKTVVQSMEEALKKVNKHKVLTSLFTFSHFFVGEWKGDG